MIATEKKRCELHSRISIKKKQNKREFISFFKDD